jgi:hypothetical protein
VFSQLGPPGAAFENDEGDAPGSQILLMADPPVSREQNIEAGVFSGCKSAPLLRVSQPLHCAV